MPKRLSIAAIRKQLAGVPGWRKKGAGIVREYRFSNFLAAMVFVNFVADCAEGMDHHPDVLIEYNRVTLTLSTHSAKGLTELDFRLARTIDA